MILVTTVGLFCAESALVVFFLLGVGLAFRSWSARVVGSLTRVESRRVVRFLWFQLLFVAVWSVVFKGVLYTTLRHSYAHRLLSGGQSLGIAIPAEVLMLLCSLVGFGWWVGRAFRR